MTLNEIKSAITDAGYTPKLEKRWGAGTRLGIPNCAVVCAYDSGKYFVYGPQKKLIWNVLDAAKDRLKKLAAIIPADIPKIKRVSVPSLKTFLQDVGYQVLTDKPLGNGLGTQILVQGGPIVIVYNTGKCVLQGKNIERLRPLLQKALPLPQCKTSMAWAES